MEHAKLVKSIYFYPDPKDNEKLRRCTFDLSVGDKFYKIKKMLAFGGKDLLSKRELLIDKASLKLKQDFNIFKFFQEHQKMKALLSLMFKKRELTQKDINFARTVYINKHTVCDTNDK